MLRTKFNKATFYRVSWVSEAVEVTSPTPDSHQVELIQVCVPVVGGCNI
jgi:hypothetical protein